MRVRRFLRPISRERYASYINFVKLPSFNYLLTEIKFFSTPNEKIIGVIFVCNTDHDFGFALFCRNSKHQFEIQHISVSNQSIDMALDQANLEARRLSNKFDSDQKMRPKIDIFSPMVDESKLHENFKLVSAGLPWVPARKIINEIMHHFTDIDGNFVEQFQTTGFDSRLWELFVYSVLKEEKLIVDRMHEAPDFLISDGSQSAAIEAVTVNKSAKDYDRRLKYATFSEEFYKETSKLGLSGRMHFRYGSALKSKMDRKKSYWTLPHVVGLPFLFAIADFHDARSMIWSTSPLYEYLYGIRHKWHYNEAGELVVENEKIASHKFDGREIASGFFFQENSENVSAVIFSATGTISKFGRMGRLAGFGDKKVDSVQMLTYHDHDPNAASPLLLIRKVEPGKMTETWCEGVSVYHNPNAKYPFPEDLLPSVAHHHFIDGNIVSRLPNFHVYSSITYQIAPPGSIIKRKK